MTNLARYIDLIIEPTLEEFKSRRTSIRHAFLACVAIYHAIDAPHGRRVIYLRQKWGKQSPAFKLVDIIVHQFKHANAKAIILPPAAYEIAHAMGLDNKMEQMNVSRLLLVARAATDFLRSQARSS